MILAMSDVRKRTESLNSSYVQESSININTLIDKCKTTTSVNILESYFKGWTLSKQTNEYAFVESLSLLDSFRNNSKNKSDINKAISLFSEMVLPKVTNMKKARTAIQQFVKESNIGQELLEQCAKYIACDRVLGNHSKLAKKHNIDKLVAESNTSNLENTKSLILELCQIVDSYNMNFAIKYNVALENVLYLFSKHHVRCTKKTIMENVTDYFLCNIDQDKLNSMKTILKESEFYDSKDEESVAFIVDDIEDDEQYQQDDYLGGINLESAFTTAKSKGKELFNTLKKEVNKTPEKIKQLITKVYTKSPENVIEETPNFLNWLKNFLVFGTFAINVYIGIFAFLVDRIIATELSKKQADEVLNDFNKQLNSIEKQLDTAKDEKKKQRLKAVKDALKDSINKLEEYRDSLYTDSELDKRDEDKYSSIDESYEGFEDLNHIPLQTYMTDYHTQVVSEMYKARNVLETYVNSKYKNLLDKRAIVLSSIEDLRKFENISINKMSEYVGEDGQIYICIGDFLPLNYSTEVEKLNECRDIASNICDYVEDKIDFNFCVIYDGSDDLYHIFMTYNTPIILDEEPYQEMHVELKKTAALILALESEVTKLSEEDVEHLLAFVDNDIEQVDMETIDTVSQFSITASDLVPPNQLVDIFNEHKQDLYKNDKSPRKYIRTSCLQENINKLNKVDGTRSQLTIFDEYHRLVNENEAINAFTDMINVYANRGTITETSFVNTLKLAKERLKDKTKNLSDREKMVSRNLDNSLDRFMHQVQTDLTNKNREAVIKGKIIPSASTIIKIGIASGIAAMINPALAVIGVLGGIASAKIGTAQERQYILDEIDVQLKVVEKKIQLAERSDDMKTMEELLKIEQKLKREKSRIQYHKKDYVPVRKND